ncbi:22656_t:CDS:1, partial [Dentiscutata erythropus]
ICQVLAECAGWRITSPTTTGLVWTAGQYYAVSWDPGYSQVNTVDQVDLYTNDNKFVVTEWKGPISVNALTTGNFRLQAPSPGTYHSKK